HLEDGDAQEEVDGVDRDAMGVATSYTYQKARAYFTYGQAEEDFNNNDLSYYTVGAEYYLSNDILTFIEYSEVENRDFTLSDEDLMMLGMYYTF
ncbi:porin, partial [Vibrio lentus]